MKRTPASIIFLLSMIMFFGNTPVFASATKIRAAHFQNVTHAPVLIARATHHFEKLFGESVKIDWKTFNAGPEAVEALFAGEIDILYVGPNPAINGFIRSRGEALRVIAGVASGGSGFVVRNGSGIEKFEDIRGKRVSSPQKGNGQDTALLYLMSQKNITPKNQGGDVELFNISGGDQITALSRNQVDAIWTVEPWVSRLVSEANGKILFEEKELWPDGKYATTLLVVRKKFADEHPDLVQKWVKAHMDIMNWVDKNLSEAKSLFNQELKRESGKELPPDYLDRSFGRITFTYEPMKEQVLESAKHAFVVGYLGKSEFNLDELYDLSFLNQAKNDKR